MAKEKKKKSSQEQGKEGVEKKEGDEKAQEKEKLLPNVDKEKETEATEEVKKDENKSMGENEKENKDGKEEKKQDEKLEAPSAKPKPSHPSLPEEMVLKVFMHCKGCAKKVHKSLKDLEGVEDVKTDCKTNTVVVKGKMAAQDPKRVADALYRKSGKRAEILSPIPVPLLTENVAIVEILEKKKEEKTKEKKESQEGVVVVLKVNMHCEACAEQIKARILKLSGVEEVETNLGTSQVNVKGNFDPDMLVKYIYKRTGKHAFIVKQEGIPTAEKLTAAGDAKPVDDMKQENNAKENGKKEEESEEKSEEEKKEVDEKNSPTTVVAVTGPGNGSKGIGAQHNYYYYPRYPMEYAYPYQYPYPYPNPFPHPHNIHPNSYQYQYQYPYMPPPAPALQIFSDENPNACKVM